MLLENNVDFNSTDNDDCVPLHYAALYGNLQAVKFIWSNGSALDVENKHGWQPIHFAAASDKPEVMNFLIENDIFIDSLTENNLTPLMISAQTNSTYTLNFLLDHGAEINKVNTENALIMAIKNNCINTGEILINRGIDINYQDSSKWTDRKSVV